MLAGAIVAFSGVCIVLVRVFGVPDWGVLLVVGLGLLGLGHSAGSPAAAPTPDPPDALPLARFLRRRQQREPDGWRRARPRAGAAPWTGPARRAHRAFVNDAG